LCSSRMMVTSASWRNTCALLLNENISWLGAILLLRRSVKTRFHCLGLHWDTERSGVKEMRPAERVGEDS